MAALEAEVFVAGNWKSYEELENEMSIPELIHTINHLRNAEYEKRKFAAALKGVDIDGEGSEDPIEKARKANRAKSMGDEISPDDVVANPEFSVNGPNGLLGYELI